MQTANWDRFAVAEAGKVDARSRIPECSPSLWANVSKGRDRLTSQTDPRHFDTPSAATQLRALSAYGSQDCLVVADYINSPQMAGFVPLARGFIPALQSVEN